jgi:hypothetical protein
LDRERDGCKNPRRERGREESGRVGPVDKGTKESDALKRGFKLLSMKHVSSNLLHPEPVLKFLSCF